MAVTVAAISLATKKHGGGCKIAKYDVDINTLLFLEEYHISPVKQLRLKKAMANILCTLGE